MLTPTNVATVSTQTKNIRGSFQGVFRRLHNQMKTNYELRDFQNDETKQHLKNGLHY